MLRAGAHLAANKYGQPILGLIFLRYADILFKQHKKDIEAEEICGRMIDSHQSAEECAIQLRAMGAMNVVISMADKGAVLAADDGNVYRITAPSGKVASSVGAGDAFLAGFLAGHGKTGEFREALRWGTAAGSATAFTDGLCSKADFDRLLSEVHYG